MEGRFYSKNENFLKKIWACRIWQDSFIYIGLSDPYPEVICPFLFIYRQRVAYFLKEKSDFTVKTGSHLNVRE